MSLTLLDWRRRVAELYAAVRAGGEVDRPTSLARFRAGRDELLRHHPDSPLGPDDHARDEGLEHWPYRGDLRFEVPLVDAGVEPEPSTVASSAGEEMPLRRIGRIELPMGSLDVYWIDVYGGGAFVPFRDTTAGEETYGGGRYLIDTVKGADLGGSTGHLVVDFDYAYHPSCAYDPRWSCPLAPPGNRLAIPIRAGERGRFSSGAR